MSAAPTRVILLGAAGRMGLAITRLLLKGLAPSLRLVAAIDRPAHPAVGTDIALLAGAGAPCGIPLADDLAAALAALEPSPSAAEAPVVAIDFSHHAAAPATAALLAAHNVAWLLGTTGLTPEETAAADASHLRIPYLHAANMSLGVNVLAALVAQAATALKGQGYDVEIVEAHHHRKADAPSGTALMLGRAAANAYGWQLDEVARDGRTGVPGPRPEQEIAFHAIRGGDIVGDHSVLFIAEGEMLSLGHRMTSRDTLAAGALRAAAWLGVPGRLPGTYTMAYVLGLAH